MRERRGRVDELEAVRGERQRLQERREHHQRVDGGADVVDEARLGELERARGAADRRLGLEDAHRAAGAASVMAAARPFGPEPMTTASSVNG
jgi:hypothetical protein